MVVTKPVRTPILTDKQKKELRAKEETSQQVSLFGEIKEEMTISKVLAKKLIYLGDEERQREKRDVELIKECLKGYQFACKAHIDRGTMMDAITCNRICENLNKSMELESYDTKSVRILKDIIKTVAYIDNPFSLIYIYSNQQSDFIRLLGQINGLSSKYIDFETIDRAYKEVLTSMPARKLIYHTGE